MKFLDAAVFVCILSIKTSRKLKYKSQGKDSKRNYAEEKLRENMGHGTE
jgi:hypothetical protein